MKKTEPKISIIIPVYNVERYLRQCLDSVISQTFQNLEIIIINDGSADNSLSICMEYEKKDPRIKLINQKNSGVSKARNTGLELASGKYVSFVDSDDYLAPDFIEKLSAVLETEDADFVISSIETVGDNIPRNQIYQSQYQKRLYEPHFPISPLKLPPVIWARLYRMDLIKKYNLKFPKDLIFEDNYWNFMFCCYATKYQVIRKKLYFHRKDNDNSIMSEIRFSSEHKYDTMKISCCIYDSLHKTENVFLLKELDRFFYQELKYLIRLHGPSRELAKEINKYLKRSKPAKILLKKEKDTIFAPPKISVIIPVYNAEKYLRQCLDTVIGQSLKKIEILLIDDGSTDSSLSICYEYKEKDSRVHVFHQENQGAGIARNYGIKLAKGEYLSFLDSDDFFELDMLEKLYNKCSTTDSDICICRSKELRNNRVKSTPWTLKTDYLWSNFFSSDNYFFSEHIFQTVVGWAWDKLFKSDLVKKHHLLFSPTLHSNDLVFCFGALSVAKRITYIEDELIFHRYHSNSLASSQDRKPEEFMKAILSLSQKLKELGTYEKCYNSFIEWIENFSNWHFMSMKNLSSKKKVLECIKQLNQQFPFDIKKLLNYLGHRHQNPKVSVIIPVYNVQKYLDKAILSVINQKLKNIEIICVNDGSTDNSLSILQKYQKRDPRIRIINKKNSGYGHSVNTGIFAATGEYIAILESDDYILPDMYQVLYETAQKHNVDFVKSDFYRLFGDRKNCTTEHVPIADPAYYNRVVIPPQEAQIGRMGVQTWCGIYKREFLVKNRILHNETPGARFQDNGFFIKTLCCAKRIFLINKAFYMYRCDRPDASIKTKNRFPYLTKEHKLNYQWLLSHFSDRIHLSMFTHRLFCSFFWAISNDQNRKKAIYGSRKILLKLNKKGILTPDFFSEKEWKKIVRLIKYPEKL